ncbi:MAG TPA: hypothetical protein VGK16_04570 [Candidatus Limnocylindrales bacterium]
MKRLVRPALGAVMVLALAATPAFANHHHVMSIGDGRCVILAPDGGEDEVELPQSVFDSNPNVDITAAPDRLHPLHVLVHKGMPGDHNQIAVAGTADAAALCWAGIVND